MILASRKISTALAAGCSVIVKPDVITPGSVMEIVDICREAGVPPGVVNLLSGDPAGISEELIKSDIVKKISITGSTKVGKLILKQAADKVQRVTMELSGHSPFIVFDDVDLDKSSTLCLIISEIFLIIFDLSQGEVFLQICKPFSADFKALWTSSLFAFDAFPITSSVAGLITS